jgi:hypothetical protein
MSIRDSSVVLPDSSLCPLSPSCFKCLIRVIRVFRRSHFLIAANRPLNLSPRVFFRNHKPSKHLPQKQPNYSPRSQVFAPRGELIGLFQSAAIATNNDIQATSKVITCQGLPDLFATDVPGLAS